LAAACSAASFFNRARAARALAAATLLVLAAAGLRVALAACVRLAAALPAALELRGIEADRALWVLDRLFDFAPE
jgi:hypothetical protein